MRARPLQAEIKLPEEITLLPNEERREEIKFEGGFLAKPKKITVKFTVQKEVISAKEVEVQGAVVAAAAVDYNPEESTLDLYALVPKGEEGEYFLEYEVNTPSTEDLSKSEITGSVITGAAIGITERSTLASDILGPFHTQENQSLLVGQQFLHGVSYKGPAEIVLRIRKNNDIVSEQKFLVNFGESTGVITNISSVVFWLVFGMLVICLLIPSIFIPMHLRGNKKNIIGGKDIVGENAEDEEKEI